MGRRLNRLIFILVLSISAGFLHITPSSFESSFDALAAEALPHDGLAEGVKITDIGAHHLPTHSLSGLDRSTRIALPRFESSLRQHADFYGVDWRLALAVMKHESHFREDAESDRGASGLMQIMPHTEAELAQKLGVDDLNNPHKNIRGGIFYLSTLYDLFEGAMPEDRLKLTLAAYNAGPGRIYDAQEIAAYLGDDPYSWPVIQKVLPLLSKRYHTLHRLVWDGGKPRNGHFGKSRQTILYVHNVMESFEQYQAILN